MTGHGGLDNPEITLMIATLSGMTPAAPRRSTLAVLLLALLVEAPMHPYKMQQTIRERGQDQLVNVAQRNSVYQTLDRLVRADLARPAATSRDGGRPERTVYELTPAGAATLRRWLIEMLGAPAREFPEFPLALALIAVLDPAETRRLLDERRAAVSERITTIEGQAPPDVPRLFLIEDEYRAAMLTAERDWLSGLIADLDEGRLTWPKAL